MSFPYINVTCRKHLCWNHCAFLCLVYLLFILKKKSFVSMFSSSFPQTRIFSSRTRMWTDLVFDLLVWNSYHHLWEREGKNSFFYLLSGASSAGTVHIRGELFPVWVLRCWGEHREPQWLFLRGELVAAHVQCSQNYHTILSSSCYVESLWPVWSEVQCHEE